jgi:hypothetical protein
MEFLVPGSPITPKGPVINALPLLSRFSSAISENWRNARFEITSALRSQALCPCKSCFMPRVLFVHGLRPISDSLKVQILTIPIAHSGG